MRRTYLTSLLPLLAMAVLAGITYWLLQITATPPAAVAPAPKTHTPDYFADNFSITMLDRTGATQYRINAATMVHYEDDDNTHVTDPAIRAFTASQPEVTSTAKRGIINADGSIVDLYDDARVKRAPGDGDPAMEADSEHFRFFVNDDIVQTKNPVKLQRGQSVMTADGMIYNNVTRQMQLLGKVRGLIAASDVPSTGPFQ
jgi:lipopolysaccharide export system protein LptC